MFWPFRLACWLAIAGALAYLFFVSALWSILGVGVLGASLFAWAEIDEALDATIRKARDGCCGAYAGTHQRRRSNAFCDCGCHR